MRKQFDGIAALVESQLGQEPRSGHLFVVFNKTRHAGPALLGLRPTSAVMA